MKRASISEAKNGLSALLDRVRHGESVLIEDRGVPVARLEPVVSAGKPVDGRAARLQRLGIARSPLTAPPTRVLSTPPPQPRRGVTASQLLVDERREGR